MNDVLKQICNNLTAMWDYFTQMVTENSDVLQITLLLTVIFLIAASCVYKRRRLAKTAIN